MPSLGGVSLFATSCDMFFVDHLQETDVTLCIEGQTAQHITRSLRKKVGDTIALTDGKGKCYYSKITALHPKYVHVILTHKNYIPPSPRPSIAVGSLKNTDRIEWLIEKVTEIGIQKIYILQSQRTLKKYASKVERLRHIMRAALLQSQQTYLPELWVDVPFITLLQQHITPPIYIAHCHPTLPKISLSTLPPLTTPPLILIGPEGDFTEEEIQQATLAGAHNIQLCPQRLRTETAALYTLSFFTATSQYHPP